MLEISWQSVGFLSEGAEAIHEERVEFAVNFDFLLHLVAVVELNECEALVWVFRVVLINAERTRYN